MTLRESCGRTLIFETVRVLALYDLQTATLVMYHRLANMSNTLTYKFAAARAWYTAGRSSVWSVFARLASLAPAMSGFNLSLLRNCYCREM